MTIDEENRQWVWECLLRTRKRLKTMTQVAETHRQAAMMMKSRLYEADNPKDYYEIELKEAALHRKIQRIKRMPGLR